MKFIKLEILNLASLDRIGGEIINFEEGVLGDSTIFSIVGPTGSGKSTILDAICLALYNRAPRYPRKKGEKNQAIQIFGTPEEGEKNRLAPTDSRNILTRGKKEGYSKLTFLANNGDIYRAEWSVRIKTKNFDSAALSLYKISVKDGVTVEEQADWESLPQIIGLGYDQFLRTVLIAQGSFASFLTANENERYELLEKLIGCEETYTNIAAKIKLQKDEAVRAYDQIAANFSAQEKDIIPEEDLAVLKERIAELETIEKNTKAELLKVTEAITWYINDEKFLENIAKYESAFNEARSNKDAFGEKADRLALHDATLAAVALYKDVKSIEKDIKKLEKELKQFGDIISKGEQDIKKDTEVNLTRLQQNAQKALDELERQKPHINKAREIKAELDGLQKVLTEKTAAKKDAEKAAANADREVANNKVSIKKAEAALKKAQEENSQLLDNIKKEEQQFKEALAKVESDIAGENKKIEGVDIEELNADIEALLRTHTLMTSENWEEHRTLLKDGEPCPLCGGLHHPYADQEAASLRTSELKLNLEKKQQLQKDYNQTKKTLDALFKKKDKANADIQKHAEQIQSRKEKAADKVTNANTVLETEKGKTANLLAQLKEKTDALTNAIAALNKAVDDVKVKTSTLKQEIGDKDPDTFEKSLTLARDKADKAVKAKIEEIALKRETLNGTKGEQSAKKDLIESKTATILSKQKELAKKIDEYNQNNEQQLTEQDIALLYSSTDNWEEMRAEQKDLAKKYTSAETTLKNETEAHRAHQEKKPDKQKKELLARKSELEALSHQELVEHKARLTNHEKAKEQMGMMFDRKQEAELLKKEWEQITDAIGADGKTLRKIAQCYTLRFLIEHANVEIRKFNSRYELQQVKNSLGIRVIDHDRADDVRDTTSLSGGETFIVSLGLALGLSSLSSRNISFENLFIDEGFGTLDPDTLATVIDSLAMLQSSQGKKVGVISHTDTMSERITTQIRIIKNGNSGSSHIEIYP